MNAKTRFAGGEHYGRGTRFRLYPQPSVRAAMGEPETVWLAAPPGSISPGPSDDRMYVVDAIGKDQPYEFPDLPPYRGARNPPLRPASDGHFDHLDPASREFMAAHMYGTLRFVLDAWDRYFGAPIPWDFATDFPRLELVPLVEWNNAHSGYGFIETGFARPGEPDPLPFCLNFDVLAHELGHAFLYSLLGSPPATDVTAQAGVPGTGYALGVCIGDYNNDGNPDIYISNFGTNVLYRNKGDGSFTGMTTNQVGQLVADGALSYTGTWGDCDNDGYLDLYVTLENARNYLYHNNRNGTFSPLVLDSGSYTGMSSPTWGDYDNDGLLDLFVARTNGCALHHNLGSMTFSNVTTSAGFNKSMNTYVGAWGDYDDDGLSTSTAIHLPRRGECPIPWKNSAMIPKAGWKCPCSS